MHLQYLKTADTSLMSHLWIPFYNFTIQESTLLEWSWTWLIGRYLGTILVFARLCCSTKYQSISLTRKSFKFNYHGNSSFGMYFPLEMLAFTLWDPLSLGPSNTVDLWISTRALIANLREDRGAYVRSALNRGGGLIKFFLNCDHFFNTSSVRKQQHRLFINIKRWS